MLYRQAGERPEVQKTGGRFCIVINVEIEWPCFCTLPLPFSKRWEKQNKRLKQPTKTLSHDSNVLMVVYMFKLFKSSSNFMCCCILFIGSIYILY